MPLGSKDCLMNSEIDKLQNYYGSSIGRNVSNLNARREMCLFSCIVDSVQPQHGLRYACSQEVRMGTLHLVLICKILRINMLIKLNFVRTVSPNQAKLKKIMYTHTHTQSCDRLRTQTEKNKICVWFSSKECILF
jgi:hypothetical protein